MTQYLPLSWSFLVQHVGHDFRNVRLKMKNIISLEKSDLKKIYLALSWVY